MSKFTMHFELNEIKGILNKIKERKPSFKSYGALELCYYEDINLMASVYLGIYEDELCWVFSEIIEIDEDNKPYNWDNVDSLYVEDVDIIDSSNKENLENQAKNLLENWCKNRLQDMIE